MRKLYILLCCFLPCFLGMAQQITEYNRKGDEAMERKDYTDARLWYGEGISYCDRYSIEQLTHIWRENEAMRLSMRSLMTKCLNCLTVSANSNDTTAIRQLIEYYDLGIGTSRNRDLANHWKRRLNDIEQGRTFSTTPRKPIDIHYFIGYVYSLEAPFGINAGMTFDRFGFYLRYKSRFSNQNAPYVYEDGRLSGLSQPDFYEYKKKKVNYYAASAGFVAQFNPWLYGSLGAGYFNRELIYMYDNLSDTGRIKEQIWAKNNKDSYSGAIVDVDMMARFGSSFYVNAGVSILAFKYVDLNVGVGLFF